MYAMESTANTHYPIFVPEAECGIDVGSGIVGEYVDGDVEVDFEGNRFGAVGLETWIERVAHAAGRRVERYPTAARRRVPAAMLVEVGTFDVEGGIAYLDNPAAVRAWCGETEIYEVVLTARTGRRNEVRARLMEMGLRGNALEQAAARYGG